MDATLFMFNAPDPCQIQIFLDSCIILSVHQDRLQMWIWKPRYCEIFVIYRMWLAEMMDSINSHAKRMANSAMVSTKSWTTISFAQVVQQIRILPIFVAPLSVPVDFGVLVAAETAETF